MRAARYRGAMIEVPARLIEERHLAATGPGGQNVNKVATAIQLRVDIAGLDLPPPVLTRLRAFAGSRLTADGVLVLTGRRHRTQQANRADALARLAALLERAHDRPAHRIKTRPTRAAKARRIEAKVARARIKATRGRPALE